MTPAPNAKMSRTLTNFLLTRNSLTIGPPARPGIPAITAAIILACLGSLSLAFADDLSNPHREFAFNGKPIHPLLIRKFEPWVSDARPPIITEVNLSAAWDSNEYAANFKTDSDGTVSLAIPEGASFSYLPLGTSRKGIHILRTFSSGGGTGVFQAVLLLRTQTRVAYLADGIKSGEQVFLQVLRRFPLGDRDDAEIIVKRDRVIIGKSRYRTEPVELTLDQLLPLPASEKTDQKGKPND
jgi:hypothetical protein